jgi:hypothetical protein
MHRFDCKFQATTFLLCFSVSQLSTSSLCFCGFAFKPNSCDFFLSKVNVLFLYIIKSNLQIYRNTPHNPSRRHKQPYKKNGALVSTIETESEKRVTVKKSLWFLCIVYSIVERNVVIGVRSLAN